MTTTTVSDTMRLCSADTRRMMEHIDDLKEQVRAGTISPLETIKELSSLRKDLEIAKENALADWYIVQCVKSSSDA